jgi:alginate O-acetyltransferase complex protein AlgI
LVFSSIVFLVYFFPLFLLVYFIANKRYKNIVILVFSVIFYSWGAPKFIFVILATTLLDFFLVRFMWRMEKRLYRRAILTASLLLNLGLLVYFKYSNFFIENINAVLVGVLHTKSIEWTKFILPLGISFYTFETITYVVDVYRKAHKPLSNFWDYQLYIILFPKLIAGPIIRYNELADQITDRPDNIDDKLTGFYRFTIGLSKKVFIANQMGFQADTIFAMNYQTLDSYSAWIGILAYTFQIYFDFSGYSDMAIGIGRMMGFRFPENFNNPYISQSITEFWRRWHITLGNWMKNYLYIPLGGNRTKSKAHLYFNLWLVFIVSGLWHGASWSFILWGAYHGFFLVMERSFLLKIYQKIGKLTSTAITFLIVVVGWIFFRVEKISDAFIYIERMFSFRFKESNFDMANNVFYTFFMMAVFFAFFAYFKRGQVIQDAIFVKAYTNTRHTVICAICILLLVLSIGNISGTGFNPFLYFRF